MNENYSVKIEEYALRHYIKTFEKKYKHAWDIALKAIISELERIDKLQQTDKAEIISSIGNLKIVKVNFRIPGRPESAKSSGNRIIVGVDVLDKKVRVLLVYGKTDLNGGNETAEWKKIIKREYDL